MMTFYSRRKGTSGFPVNMKMNSAKNHVLKSDKIMVLIKDTSELKLITAVAQTDWKVLKY